MSTDLQNVDPRRRRSSGAGGPGPRTLAPRNSKARHSSGDAGLDKVSTDQPDKLVITPSLDTPKASIAEVEPSVEVRDPRRRNQVDDPRMKEHR